MIELVCIIITLGTWVEGGLNLRLAYAKWPPAVGRRGVGAGGQAHKQWLTNHTGQSRPPHLPPPSASGIKTLFLLKQILLHGDQT